MVTASVEIDRAALARLEAVLAKVERETPQRLATETRRAAIYVCQALKKRTRKAPKRIRRNEWEAEPSPNPPRYVHSNSAGRPLLRRWALTRKRGTPDAYTRDHYVYTKARPGRGGRMVGKSAAGERRELLARHGGISRPGLAKLSWGWIAKRIYNAAAEGDLSFRRGKIRRDPRRAVSGKFARAPRGAMAELVNALDYIAAACPSAAVSEAVEAAAKRLEHNIDKHIERTTK